MLIWDFSMPVEDVLGNDVGTYAWQEKIKPGIVRHILSGQFGDVAGLGPDHIDVQFDTRGPYPHIHFAPCLDGLDRQAGERLISACRCFRDALKTPRAKGLRNDAPGLIFDTCRDMKTAIMAILPTEDVPAPSQPSMLQRNM